MRTLIAASTLILATGETALAEADFGRYALTQGGLLVVVLVLLWMYRRDNERISKKDDEKIVLLTDLVSQNTAALARTAEALIAQERATHRLARAVEKQQ